MNLTQASSSPETTIVREKQWWEHRWGIIAMVLSGGPLGAVANYLIWRSKRPVHEKLILTAWVDIVFWFVFLALR